MKEAYYFSHDSNARNDVKHLKLRRQLGSSGYGIFWMLIEALREQVDYKLPLSSTSDLAYDFDVPEATLSAIISDFDLFELDETHFYSPRLNRSMEQYKSMKTKLSEAGKKGAEARLKQGLSNPEALKERKGNESKGNKTLRAGVNYSFKDFWNLYDKKVGNKDKLSNKWHGLKDEERTAIMLHVPKYKLAQPNKKFRKDPSTYLNNRAWEDEIITETPTARVIQAPGWIDELKGQTY